jgi:hypothetical protein
MSVFTNKDDVMTQNTSPNEAAKLTLQNVAVAFEQTKVYANKRQQARFRLELECMHDGKPDYLTESEIASLELFAYQDTDSTIPFSDSGSDSYQGWSAQKGPLGYLSQTDTSAKPGPRQAYYLYLTANPGATETLRVSFRLTGDDGSIFRTNGFIKINGVEQYNYTFDKNTGITVTRVDPVKYPPSAFELVRRSLYRSGERAADREVFDDIVTISIRLADLTKLGIRSFTCNPAGSIHWKDKVAWLRRPCFTGYAGPGEKTIHWNDDSMIGHWGGHPRPIELPTTEAEVGVIVLCGRNDIPAWTGAPEAAVMLTMIDAYGSDQVCWISFKDRERDELVVI